MIDIFFIDNKVQADYIVPECWTHAVADGTDEDGEPINLRIEVKEEWRGLFKPPEMYRDWETDRKSVV